MKNKDSLYKIGLLAAFVSLLIVGSYLFLESRKTVEQGPQKVSLGSQGSDAKKEDEDSLSWEIYENEEYGYSLKHPRLLSVRETEDQGGYLHFVRFEENKFSQGKGVAVGASEDDLTDEVERIKKAMGEDDNASLIEESSFNFGEHSAVKLLYEPTTSELGESRGVVVIEKTPYTYSISSVPEQIDDVLESFKFTKNEREGDSRENVFCGGIANVPCPQGFNCKLEGDYLDAGGTCIKE